MTFLLHEGTWIDAAAAKLPIMSEGAGERIGTPLNEGAGWPYTLSSAGPSGGMADALA